jgi:hypothetical protein
MILNKIIDSLKKYLILLLKNIFNSTYECRSNYQAMVKQPYNQFLLSTCFFGKSQF